MTADLRELLRKAIDQGGRSMSIALQDEIDAALTAPAPEPFLWWVNDKIWQHHPPLKEWLEDCQESGYLVRPLYAALPPPSPEWARKLEEQAANIIAWSCRLEAEQGAQARCLEWCRDKRRCTASFASPPASQDDARDVARLESGSWIAAEDVYRLARELDVVMNGKVGAAQRPALVDVVMQAKKAFPKIKAATLRYAVEYCEHLGDLERLAEEAEAAIEREGGA